MYLTLHSVRNMWSFWIQTMWLTKNNNYHKMIFQPKGAVNSVGWVFLCVHVCNVPSKIIAPHFNFTLISTILVNRRCNYRAINSTRLFKIFDKYHRVYVGHTSRIPVVLVNLFFPKWNSAPPPTTAYHIQIRVKYLNPTAQLSHLLHLAH